MAQVARNTGSLIITLIIGIILGAAGYYFIGITGCPYMAGGHTIMATGMNEKKHEFITAMRKLWSDHVWWTRDFIITAVANMPDKDAATQRLLHNQDEIGNAVVPYYGSEAGKKLSALLREHILISADLVEAVKVKNKAKFDEINKKWHQNSVEIAKFLSSANPHWPEKVLQGMLFSHLQLTIDEASARIAKKWQDDVKAFDKVFDEIMMMADALANGIIKQFPNKF